MLHHQIHFHKSIKDNTFVGGDKAAFDYNVIVQHHETRIESLEHELQRENDEK